MENRKFGAITSSTNSEEVATRVKGIVLSLSAVIIFIASQVFHITLTASDIVTLGTEISGVAGSIVFIYGAVMWLLTKIFKTK